MDFPDIPITADSRPAVSFFFEDTEFEMPNPELIRDWLMAIAGQERKPFGELNVIYCSDEYLRKINIEYLNHDYYTDIITFQHTEGVVHGDLFISVERVSENAQIQAVPFFHELCRVLAHGVLHLAGYKDKTPEDQQIMRAKEDFYLTQIPI